MRRKTRPATLEAQSQQTVHPFISELIAYRQQQLNQLMVERHYSRQRRRMDRACRRRSRRHRGCYHAYYTTSAFIEAHGYQHYARLTRGNKPDLWWRGCAALDAERIQHLQADLRAINLDLEGRGLDPVHMDGRRLCFQVIVDDLDGEDLGTFDVALDPCGAVYVTGGAYSESTHVHPHVASDGLLCLGEFSALGKWLHADGALDMAFTTIGRVLNTYNPSSPYVFLSALLAGDDEDDTTSCAGCDRTVSYDESYYLNDQHYCSDCVYTCTSCAETFASDGGGTTFDDDWYCELCAGEHLGECYECGDVALREDLLLVDTDELYCAECARICATCSEAHINADMRLDLDERGVTRWLCEDCHEAKPATPHPTTKAKQEKKHACQETSGSGEGHGNAGDQAA